MIIGIGYKADVGKDTVAEHLVRAHGFHRFAYGDILRDLCSRVFGWSNYQLLDRVEKEAYDERWDMTRRQGVQRMGDALRNEFGDDVLVRNARMVFKALSAPGSERDLVVSDIRKRVECEEIKAAGGLLICLDRPGAHAISAHKTESELDGYPGWDFTVNNDSTIENMLVVIDTILKGRLKR